MEAVRTADEIRDVNTRYHDVAADTYDTKWGIDFGEIGQGQVLGKLRKLLGRELDEGYDRSLEIGAGTGYFSLNLLQAGVVSHATCTDISPGMVSTLSANAQRLGLNVKAARADAESLPFADESFDLLLGHAVLHHLPNLRRAFAEFHRVLRPGGRIVFAGEPSRLGDTIASVPKRGAGLVAPVWRRLLRAAPTTRSSTTSSGSSTSTPSRPATCPATPAAPGSPRCRSEARNWRPTGSGGSTGRWRPRPIPTTCRCCGASTRSTAICCCSGWIRNCWSLGCRRRCSTTCC